MRLYLIRHAESANNVLYAGTDNVDGRTPDPEITDTGHSQAQLLARHIAEPGNEPRLHPEENGDRNHYGLTHLYCSLMTRSMLTAEYISKTCQVKLEALPDIFERKGLYEFDGNGNEVGVSGPGRQYFTDRFPDIALPDSLDHTGWWDRPAESDADFFSRVNQSLANINSRHGHTDDSVGMVVHGDYIDQCINALMDVERQPQNYNKAWVANWVFHNTSVSRIDLVSGSRHVVYLNRIDHLPAGLVTW
jgi:2,3-bisphosphoglycerate-dependent phosphoglycerate mutase